MRSSCVTLEDLNVEPDLVRHLCSFLSISSLIDLDASSLLFSRNMQRIMKLRLESGIVRVQEDHQAIKREVMRVIGTLEEREQNYIERHWPNYEDDDGDAVYAPDEYMNTNIVEDIEEVAKMSKELKKIWRELNGLNSVGLMCRVKLIHLEGFEETLKEIVDKLYEIENRHQTMH